MYCVSVSFMCFCQLKQILKKYFVDQNYNNVELNFTVRVEERNHHSHI